ncbi:methionine synthase, partial [bacterium]|nr:methionine synthase [bacterium]
TNTFGATPLVLAEYDLANNTEAINAACAKIAVGLCQQYDRTNQPRFVAGSIGPTTKSLSVTGGVTFDELADHFEQQVIPLIENGVDFLLLETAIDTLNLKAAYIGILEAFKKLNRSLPIAVSATIETMGTMLAGQPVDAFYTSIAHMNPLYVGLNCATGPEFMRDHIRTLSTIAKCPVAVVPNAGIPDPDGKYPEDPDTLAKTLFDFAKSGWINIVGGCCGTTPAHIAALTPIRNISPRRPQKDSICRISGIDPLTIEDEGRAYIVGERTNVIGSRAFKTLITEEQFETAGEIARKQVRAGAHIVDVCLSNPDRNEIVDMNRFMGFATKLVKVPFMIDSQVPEVVEAALKTTQGKCILNSVNLEDDGKSMRELMPLVTQYGAAVVVGCIAEEMAVTAEEKVAVAARSHHVLTQEYGVREEDIVFDPLVFPCGTGDQKYVGSGKETIEGIRRIKAAFPRCKTVLGISNVSFGLPAAGREVLNAVFLHDCAKAGLDMAIVNAERLVRYATIPDEERALCRRLIDFDAGGSDPIAAFVSYFRQKKQTVSPAIVTDELSMEKRLELNIVQGTKENLIPHLDLALATLDPMGVINGPLMAAMDIVGRLFNDNELIVAEVLQSAEVMKAAVAYLEPMMSKADVSVRGTMLLATVKGDVHDIGKNLVQIILSNNGYRVIDLGIKCPNETIIQAYHEHQPTLIGLSGLLVKSAQQMVSTVADLKTAGIRIPVLVGGAALTESFTRSRIQPEYDGPVIYCRDAMTGLDVANQLSNPDRRDGFLHAHQQSGATQVEVPVRGSTKRLFKEKVAFVYPDCDMHPPRMGPVVATHTIDDVWPYINPQMLLGNHFGYKGNVKNQLVAQEPKLMTLLERVGQLKQRIREEGLLVPQAKYRYFRARREENTIVIYDDEGQRVWHRFVFPRQSEGLGLCLSDFIQADHWDVVCMFVVTCGQGVAEKAKGLMLEGDYFDSHGISSIALESAEAYAEFLHREIRHEWGIPDEPDTSIEALFKLKYQGVRVSFGYPACPRLEDQSGMFDLLTPEDIGVSLSEEWMMYPEASVSAMVFRHPQARYFTISEDDMKAFEASLGV